MEVDEQLPRECDGLSEVKIRAAKNISSKTGKSLTNACLFLKQPTETGRNYFTKRPLPADGGRKTRRVRKNKKRQQKKSRRNYK